MAGDPQLWQAAAAEEPTLTSETETSRPQRSQKLSVAATEEPHSGHVRADVPTITVESEV